MDEKIYEIGVAQFNPYVRYVNRLEGAVHENHIVPWRILYDFEIIFVTKGSLQVLKEDSEYTIGEGCLHIMPPFVRHTRVVPEHVATMVGYDDMHYFSRLFKQKVGCSPSDYIKNNIAP